MQDTLSDDLSIDRRLAQRLKALRTERGWSLDDLAGLSQVSRATLSRLENAEVSPTANVLGKLCAAYGLAMSRLMHMVEDSFAPLVRRDEQEIWADPEIDFSRRSVSPPAQSLAGEVLACALGPGTRSDYDTPPRSGLEHHLVMIEGRLRVTLGDRAHDLEPGDCLRYQLHGASAFSTPADRAARYLLFVV